LVSYELRADKKKNMPPPHNSKLPIDHQNPIFDIEISGIEEKFGNESSHFRGQLERTDYSIRDAFDKNTVSDSYG